MKRRVACSIFSLCLCITGIAAEVDKPTTPLSDLELGRRIYREGILPNGQPLQATGAAGVKLTGKQLTCANCHRRSGFGTSEGSRRVPAITGKILYSPLTKTYREIHGGRHTGAGARPAYTESALIRAITQGVDVNGRDMDPLMPRFVLNDTELKLVINYLNTLETDHAPGITDTDIHFATILTPSASAAQKKTISDTIQTFFENFNAETRGEDRRAKHGPWTKTWMYGSFRHLQIHTWELTGPAEQWQDQLQKYYAQQPVYAVVNGIGLDDWQPVHEFCEAMEIPCLFPTTDIPGKSPDPFYSMYFSAGIELEARVAANFLSQDATTAPRILQVYRAERTSQHAAATVTATLQQSAQANVTDLKLAHDQTLTRELLQQQISANQPDTLLLWLPATELPVIDEVVATTPSIKKIILSRSFIPAATKLTPALLPRTYLISPFVPDNDMEKHLIRYRSWAKVHHLETPDTRVGANAYFASMMAANAVRDLRANLAREHLFDVTEHMLERGLFFSVYPNFTLGPNQRYASKGCFVIGPLAGSNNKKGQPPQQWIVPDSP
jgi:Periplasmic binding protein/Cytochrome c